MALSAFLDLQSYRGPKRLAKAKAMETARSNWVGTVSPARLLGN